MGMKQEDWKQNKENAAKGVFPENFTQRLWRKEEILVLPPFLRPHCSLPSPVLISSRTLAIEAGLFQPWQESRVPKVWTQALAAFTNCRISHFTGATLHRSYFSTWVETTWEFPPCLRDAGMGASAMPTAVLMMFDSPKPLHHTDKAAIFIHSPECVADWPSYNP